MPNHWTTLPSQSAASYYAKKNYYDVTYTSLQLQVLWEMFNLLKTLTSLEKQTKITELCFLVWKVHNIVIFIVALLIISSFTFFSFKASSKKTNQVSSKGYKTRKIS